MQDCNATAKRCRVICRFLGQTSQLGTGYQKTLSPGGGGGRGVQNWHERYVQYTQIPEHPAWNLLSFRPPSETHPFGKESMIHMMKSSCIHVVRSLMCEIFDFWFEHLVYCTVLICTYSTIIYTTEGLYFFFWKSVDRSYLYVKIWYLFFYEYMQK